MIYWLIWYVIKDDGHDILLVGVAYRGLKFSNRQKWEFGNHRCVAIT